MEQLSLEESSRIFQSYMEHLAGKDQARKEKIQALMVQLKIDASDPLFLVLLQLEVIKDFAADIPDYMEYSAKNWKRLLGKEVNEHLENTISSYIYQLQNVSQKEIEAHEKRLQQLQQIQTNEFCQPMFASFKTYLEELDRDLKQKLKQYQKFWLQPLWFVGLAGVLIFLAVFGFAVFNLAREAARREMRTIQLTPEGKYALSASEIALLQWAKSSEGRKAKDLYAWNRDWLPVCEREIKSYPIAMKANGLKATSGFCLLWTQAPEQRGFQ